MEINPVIAIGLYKKFTKNGAAHWLLFYLSSAMRTRV